MSTVSAAPATGGATHAAPAEPVSIQDLIKKLNDASLPMSERKAAIRALARLGTPEAVAALKGALPGGSDELRAAIAEGLGECTSPECTTLLLGLLNDPSQAVIQAAIRGLAQLGSPEAVAALAQLLSDSLRSSDLRSEAALGLGNINQPAAMAALAQAAVTIGDEDMVTQVLEAIGGRDFTETQSFYQKYMGSAVSSDLRVAAIDSLWQTKGDPSAFLAGYISDADAEVRASAAWAMSATDAAGNVGPQLLASLQGEQDAEVRRRLYQALANQESFETSTALALVQRETDPVARIAGMDLLASSLQNNPSPEVQTFFDQTAAPALKNAALTGASSHERMAAVIALMRASSPSAISALQGVARQATDPRVKESATRAVANPLPVMPK
jgi:HEAT repeat protein